MDEHILKEISLNIQWSTFYSLIADKTTNAANREQLVIVYHWIDYEFDVHEDFVSLHELAKTDSQSILHELPKLLNDLHLNVHGMRGKCYDGLVQCLELKVELLSFSQIWSHVQFIRIVLVMH